MRRRADALRAIDERTEVPELRTFILAMLQADTFGVSISRILRVAGRRDAHPPPAARAGAGAEGAGQDALPARVLHLPVDLRRHPGPRDHPDLRVALKADRALRAHAWRRARRPIPSAAPPTAAEPPRRATTAWASPRIVTTVFALVGWVVGIARLGDNSFFWHLRTGDYILDHGIPRGDVFSYTAPGTKWVAQSWLAEVTVRRARSLGRAVRHPRRSPGSSAPRSPCSRSASRCGSRGSWLRGTGIAVASSPACSRCGRSARSCSACCSCSCCSGSSRCPESFVGRHPLVVLPVLFWLWANVHGTFALGFAYLGLHVLGRWLDGAAAVGRARAPLVLGTVDRRASASLVNPYGVVAADVPDRAAVARRDPPHVIEWQSPDFRARWGVALRGCGSRCSCAALARGRASGHTSRPRRHGPDAPPRAVGAAQHRDRAARRPAGAGAGGRDRAERRAPVPPGVRGRRVHGRRRSSGSSSASAPPRSPTTRSRRTRCARCASSTRHGLARATGSSPTTPTPAT